ncbi:MAG TPA: response regulator transcription factor [Clostridia bacterium]|nr:response regulator transcription factor [Clostridia bacterium]
MSQSHDFDLPAQSADGQNIAASGTIRILISDANVMGCELLTNALKRYRNFQIVGCSTSIRDTREQISSSVPEVAIVNLHLQDGPFSGFHFLRELGPDKRTRVVMMIDASNRELVVDAFRGGARGVFRRSESVQSLCRCINAVARGQVWANSTELQFLLEALESAMPLRCVDAKGNALLTQREQQIVPLIADGLTNREIAQKLNLSEHTVKNYLFRIYEKLGISSRVELILYAVTQHETAA